MSLRALLLTAAIVLCPAAASAEIPGDLKSAAETADGVVIGLNASFGSGSYPFMEVWVLEVLKGADPGEKLAISFPAGTVPSGDPMAVLKKHGSKFIIAYRGPKDENGRYIYAGPVFDSAEIVATRENAGIVRPGSFRLEIPPFEQALEEADIVAPAIYSRYEPNTALNRIEFRVESALKGICPEGAVTVILGGRYLHWLTTEPARMQEKVNPLLTGEPRLLLLKEKDGKLYYAGPEFTSPYFPATPGKLAEARRLIEEQKNPPPKMPDDSGFDWTWWIVGAVAAVVALIAALLVSKVDYKYDRRRERLEKLRSGDSPDIDAGRPGR